MPKRVVAIDDSDVALAVIRETLGAHDVELITTDTPGEFFRQIYGETKPDLIMTDLEMPGITGSDIARQLKRDPRTKDIPLVILSTLPRAKLEPTARMLGANAYLCKANFDEATVSKTLLPLLGLSNTPG